MWDKEFHIGVSSDVDGLFIEIRDPRSRRTLFSVGSKYLTKGDLWNMLTGILKKEIFAEEE